jgi:hypothetical protein
MSKSQHAQSRVPPDQTPVVPPARATAETLRRNTRGFASAEAALLALVMGGICIVVGSIVQRAALQAATALNAELAGSK